MGAILLNIGYMPARFGEITYHELERDSDKAQALHMSLTLHLP